MRNHYITESIFSGGLIFILVLMPILLTGWNIYKFARLYKSPKIKIIDKLIEISALVNGFLYFNLYMGIAEIMFESWDAQLYNNQSHSLIDPGALLTIRTITVFAFLGYLLARFIPVRKQPPLLSVLCISSMYLGAGICILWIVQRYTDGGLNIIWSGTG